MCRLVAFSGEGPLDHNELFVYGSFMILSERKNNGDGAGVAVNRVGTQGAWLKSGKPAHNLVFSPNWKDCFSQWAEYDTVIGHTRLASIEWRSTGGKDGYPTKNAHPFVFGSLIGAHNGSFKEWKEKLAEKVGGEKDDYIDTMYFLDYLHRQANTDLTLDVIVETLKEVGEAKYSLLLQHTGKPEVFVIRGNAPLFYAQSNYGLFLNTERDNLVDLPDFVNHALRHWNAPPLVLEDPTFLPEYTAHTLLGGELTKLEDFGSEVKTINEPTVTTSTWTSSTGYRYGESGYNIHQEELLLDETEIVMRATGLVTLRNINPAASDEDFRLTAVDLWGAEVFDLAWLESEQLFYLVDLLSWSADTEGGIYAPSDEKNKLWFEYCSALYKLKRPLTAQEEYQLTEIILDRRIDPPFWHNTVDQLITLVEAVKKEGVDIEGDHRTE